MEKGINLTSCLNTLAVLVREKSRIRSKVAGGGTRFGDHTHFHEVSRGNVKEYSASPVTLGAWITMQTLTGALGWARDSAFPTGSRTAPYHGPMGTFRQGDIYITGNLELFGS